MASVRTAQQDVCVAQRWRDGGSCHQEFRIRVSHGATFCEVIVPAKATFILCSPIRLLISFSLLLHIGIGGYIGGEGLGFGS